MQQWHPLFAFLLRPLMQDFYEVRTDFSVGDKPREADIVLLQRTAPAPFVGIWRHLTPWNVLEFKGLTDDPALRDLDLLLEVGLGIDRRLRRFQEIVGATCFAASFGVRCSAPLSFFCFSAAQAKKKKESGAEHRTRAPVKASDRQGVSPCQGLSGTL